MESIRVGGRRYTDPDVISLIRETGQLVDPRSAVIHQARRLNGDYRSLGGDGRDPIERLKILASLRGLEVAEMDRQRSHRERRDAVVVPTGNGKRGHILFNPTRPPGRVAFSIAHEISHTFFPNSMTGARFRTMCDPDSREANELERLCDLAASELLMPVEEFRAVVGPDAGLHVVERATAVFGSSYESTVFRLATAHPGLAAAGLLRFRRRKSEERALAAARDQQEMFDHGNRADAVGSPKYRRQSFYTSEACRVEHTIRWNKSFDLASCVYDAGTTQGICRRREALPNQASMVGDLEAIRAPYQRDAAHPDFGDVLFLWWA
jgi:hypothetical protein